MDAGSAVIDAAATPRATLADYAARGVRGLRINLCSRLAGQAPQALDVAFAAMAQVARDMGWHVQVIAPLDVLIDSVDVLTRAPVPVVIDHHGLFGRSRPDSAPGQRLLELLRLPQDTHTGGAVAVPYRQLSYESLVDDFHRRAAVRHARGCDHARQCSAALCVLEFVVSCPSRRPP